MRKSDGIMLLTGSLFLYSGMSCLHVPAGVVRSSLPAVSVESQQSTVGLEVKVEKTAQEVPAAPFAVANRPTEQEGDPFLLFIRKLEAGLPVGNLYQVAQPKYTKGIYLANGISRTKTKVSWFIEQARKTGLNTFVMDVQPKMVPREHIQMVKKAEIYPVARVVVYEGGLKHRKSDPAHIERICQLIEDAGYQGFGEVQLDYIRYADEPALQRLPLKEKYNEIASILSRTKAAADRAGVLLSADLFGRITLNYNDHIGQKLENFAEYVQTIYPMVYPSHYYGDDFRMSNPYETVKEGVTKSKERIPHIRIVAYIQGFTMFIHKSGLNLQDYVAAQIRAVEDAQGDGYVIWNPRNEYGVSFAAILASEQAKVTRLAKNK